MYEGSRDYAKDGGHKELRLIARLLDGPEGYALLGAASS